MTNSQRLDHYREALKAGRITMDEYRGFEEAILKPRKLKTVQVYELRGEYAPYDRMDAFQRGVEMHGQGWITAKAPFRKWVDRQAFDRGLEYAMRLAAILES